MTAIATLLLLAFIEEFLEEEPVRNNEDVVGDFLPFFHLLDLIPDRRRVRIEGYAETVVPSYSLSEFRGHFRLSVETFEQLVIELGNCPELPTGPQYGGREPISVVKHLLITLWFLGNQKSIRSVSDSGYRSAMAAGRVSTSSAIFYIFFIVFFLHSIHVNSFCNLVTSTSQKDVSRVQYSRQLTTTPRVLMWSRHRRNNFLSSRFVSTLTATLLLTWHD